MRTNTYNWDDPALWVQNYNYSESSQAGTAYSAMMGNGSGNRIAIKQLIPLPAPTFTVKANDDFAVSLLYFDTGGGYLGRTKTAPRMAAKPVIRPDARYLRRTGTYTPRAGYCSEPGIRRCAKG